MAQLAMPMAVIGSVLNAAGTQQQGADAARSANFQAAQLDQQAGQARASAQREAAEQRRQARLAQSRVQALAGGGGLDAGVVELTSDIAGEGEYRALASLYEGEERAAGLETSAKAKRLEGKQAKRAGNMKAITSILNDSHSLYKRYAPADQEPLPYRHGDFVRSERMSGKYG